MRDKNHLSIFLQESTAIEPVIADEITDAAETQDLPQSYQQNDTPLEERFSRWVDAIDR